MHERLLSEAALPAPTVVLGLLMRPYSLGHELFLIREQSSVLNPDDVLPDDLARAAFICSNTWAENKRIHTDWLTGLKLTLLKRKITPLNLEPEVEAIREYISRAMSVLPVSEIIKPGQTESRPQGTPILLRLVQFLMLKLRLTEEQAWDYPHGLACMHWQAFWEGEGRMEIYNENEFSFDNYVRAEREKEAQQCQA